MQSIIEKFNIVERLTVATSSGQTSHKQCYQSVLDTFCIDLSDAVDGCDFKTSFRFLNRIKVHLLSLRETAKSQSSESKKKRIKTH